MTHPFILDWWRRGKTKADSPLDFAQGRLFGDDNKKGNGKSKGYYGPCTSIPVKAHKIPSTQ
jgi:hypothetical protein